MEGTSKTAGLNEEGHVPENSSAMDGHGESISGSENFGVPEHQPAASDGEDRVPERRKHHRHTPFQTQELENFYKFCPHPDERQRTELGNRIGLETKQVKFWFQNKRTQEKTKQGRQDIALMRRELDKLKVEYAMKEYATKPFSTSRTTCGGLSVLGESSNAEHNLRIENAQLKEEVERLRELHEKTLGKPVSEAVNALSRTVNARGVRNREPTGLNFGVSNGAGPSSSSTAPRHNEYEESLYIQAATSCMEEVIILAQSNSPFWRRNGDTRTEVFDHEEHRKKFNPVGVTPPGYAIEASRDIGPVFIPSLDLVNALMNPRLWVGMYPGFVVKASIVEVLCNGVAGTHDGELLLMTAELLFPSPFVPMRQVRFIRYSKRHLEGVWTVVDMSVEQLRDSFGDATKRCRRFPSGFIMQDVANGLSAVTCVEHAEYDENSVHSIFRPLVRSGLCFGAHRLLVALQRRCESLALLAASRDILPHVSSGITPEGKKSLLRLARRVITGFCAGLCASPALRWVKVNLGNTYPDLQVMTRVSIGGPGEVLGVLMSLSTSTWLPVSREKMYNFLRDDQHRGRWDLLARNMPMQEITRINKSADHSCAVSVLYPSVGSFSATDMAVVQETWSDRTMSGLAYAPVDISTANTIIKGGDSSSVKVLPSGFVINDRYVNPVVPIPNGNGPTPASLLTLGFQIMTDTIPSEKLTMHSIHTVSALMNQIIAMIKARFDAT